ncbi:unnamed protein product [Cylindrotheca closterium]|uniref:Peptidase M11 gametolysin domain-containing protein n=1 Tax=Cylindrotheca closterium TaxID=2856 RepID=A0AAD2PUA3_9STRA|nr:unnamed protein product [Cylindrotheca closterium]
MKSKTFMLSTWLQILLTLATLSHPSIADLTTFNEPCLGVVSDQLSIDGDDLLCQTPTGMLYNVSSVGDTWVEKHMLTGELFSGETILEIPANTILNTDTQTLEMDEPPSLHLQDQGRRRLRQLAKTQGDKTVLAVRVVASNSDTTHNAEEISHAIFGGPNDHVNLKSQVHACSHGKLNFERRPDLDGVDTNIRNGVVTIKVIMTVEVGHSKIVNAVSQEILRQFDKTHMDIADHVMYCLPIGAMDGVAYAIMNRGLSVYNDKFCTSVSAQMHEIGHNLNLGHSSERTEKYGDQSGMMGYSYRSSEAPKMCYNAAKSFQLGWFRDKTSSYTPGEPSWADHDRTFNLASIVDYDTTNYDVTVEILQPQLQLNYYISFNAGKEFNSGVREGKNQVLIFKQALIDGNDSWRVADLAPGQSFTVSDFNGKTGDKLTITVNSMNLGTSEAVVRLQLQQARRPTPSPTQFPTKAPTSAPTPRPTRDAVGRNPTPDGSNVTGQSCQGSFQTCSGTPECCAGYSCRRILDPSGFHNVCRAVTKNSKDKLPRTTLKWWDRRLRGDSTANRLKDSEDELAE